MKKNISFFQMVIMPVVIGILIFVVVPLTVNAYAPERPEYTVDEINQMHEDSTWAPDKIVFNSISDSIIGHEFNFVGARECTLRTDGRCEGTAGENVWNGNDITVEDGQSYIIRLFVHNNNPYGSDSDAQKAAAGTAENVRVAFHVPSESSNTVTVNGFIRTTSGEYSTYLDYVNFHSDTGNPFHLEYVYGSALLENNGIGAGGLPLPDETVNTVNGTLIGYDALDGRVPGCYQFDNYVTIQVKVVFDYNFTIENEVRLADSEDKAWYSTVEAQVGDTVEFLIGYYNNSDLLQKDVAVRDYLPKNLEYIEGSTILRNSNHINGIPMDSNKLTDGGIMIGNYGKDANAYITFKAKVVDNSLVSGSNSLVNWARGGIGFTIIEDCATVTVQKGTGHNVTIAVLMVIIFVCLIFIIVLLYKMYCWKRFHG